MRGGEVVFHSVVCPEGLRRRMFWTIVPMCTDKLLLLVKMVKELTRWDMVAHMAYEWGEWGRGGRTTTKSFFK